MSVSSVLVEVLVTTFHPYDEREEPGTTTCHDGSA
jgi:hypothetical protein